MTYRIVAADGCEPATDEILKELHRETFGLSTYMPPRDEGYWWLVLEGDVEVGFASLTQSQRFLDCGLLCRAGVLDGHRGHGLQRRLIRVRERKARALGWVTMFSDTSSNTSSANNLIACGYRLYDPAEPYGFEHTLYWRKDL